MQRKTAYSVVDLPRRILLACGLCVAFMAFPTGLSAAFAQGAEPDKTHAAPADKIAVVPGEAPADPNMPIEPDFIVNVTVAGESEPSGNYRVDPAGNIGLRYANIETPISVRGLNVEEVRAHVTDYLKAYVKAPQVSVKIVSVPRPTIWITGAVRNAGQMQVPSGTTLVDVLAHADWTENADLSQIRLTRRDMVNGKLKLEIRVIPFDKYLSTDQKATPDETMNVVLQDRDRVFVPLKTLPGSQTISIQGEVVKPVVNVPMRTSPPMTLREAISLAGGLTPTANPKTITVQRAGLDRPLVIDFQKANDGDPLSNIELKPNDSIYVERLRDDAFINMNGGFVKPGKIAYTKSMTLIQAVNEAGGPAPAAKLESGRIFRNPDGDPTHTKVLKFNWNDIESGKMKDVALQAGDSVSVSPGILTTHPDIWGILSALTGPMAVLSTIMLGR